MVAVRRRATLLLPLFATIQVSSVGSNLVAAGGNQPVQPTAVPSFVDLDYAPADPLSSKGHKLDLYVPKGAGSRMPVVVWTGGSAWRADTGKQRAEVIAGRLNPLGYVVAGVSIRSSAQVQFPGQLHDIKAAIRWLRANTGK